MRGRHDPQVTMLAFIDLETRVPPDHPLRIIKKLADSSSRLPSNEVWQKLPSSATWNAWPGRA